MGYGVVVDEVVDGEVDDGVNEYVDLVDQFVVEGYLFVFCDGGKVVVDEDVDEKFGFVELYQYINSFESD